MPISKFHAEEDYTRKLELNDKNRICSIKIKIERFLVGGN